MAQGRSGKVTSLQLYDAARMSLPPRRLIEEVANPNGFLANIG
jgi:hypothetical protein